MAITDESGVLTAPTDRRVLTRSGVSVEGLVGCWLQSAVCGLRRTGEGGSFASPCRCCLSPLGLSDRRGFLRLRPRKSIPFGTCNRYVRCERGSWFAGGERVRRSGPPGCRTHVAQACGVPGLRTKQARGCRGAQNSSATNLVSDAVLVITHAGIAECCGIGDHSRRYW